MELVLVIIWVVLALGIFAFAMRGGWRGGGEELEPGTKVRNRLTTLGVVVLFAFGLAVPTIVLFFNGEHKASAAIGGVHLDHNEVKGRELFARSCGVCHTLAATKSVGAIGPNLDIHIGKELKTPAARRALVLNAIEYGRAEGRGQMPALLYEGKEAEDIADFVAAVAGH
jgi:mono/diheme cytochrome c family protein